MENSIVQVFNCDQFQNLRVVRRGEDLWFFARYVCNALDLNITGNALAALDDDEKSELTRAEGNIVLNNVGSTGGSELLYDFSAGGRAPMLVSESGLYKLIMRSRKPSAKAFQNWLAREVLPALRRTGTYTIPGARTAVPKDYLSALEALVAAERGRVALSNQLKIIEQKLRLQASLARQLSLYFQAGSTTLPATCASTSRMPKATCGFSATAPLAKPGCARKKFSSLCSYAFVDVRGRSWTFMDNHGQLWTK